MYTPPQAFNSKHQNPCEIASVLEASCQGNRVYPGQPSILILTRAKSTATFQLGPLPRGGAYLRPQTNGSTQRCACNTVVFRYIVRPACTHQVLTVGFKACIWCALLAKTSQLRRCIHADTEYPNTIPPDTAIPNWAYYDYSVRDPRGGPSKSHSLPA